MFRFSTVPGLERPSFALLWEKESRASETALEMGLVVRRETNESKLDAMVAVEYTGERGGRRPAAGKERTGEGAVAAVAFVAQDARIEMMPDNQVEEVGGWRRRR